MDDGQDRLRATNLAHVAARDWINEHWSTHWTAAVAEGYSDLLMSWLTRTFAKMAISGAIEGVYRRDHHGRHGSAITKWLPLTLEAWRVEEWRAVAAERMASRKGNFSTIMPDPVQKETIMDCPI